MNKTERSATLVPAVGAQVERGVRPLAERLRGWLYGETTSTATALICDAAEEVDMLRTALRNANVVLQENKRRINAEPGSPVDKIIRATAKLVAEA